MRQVKMLPGSVAKSFLEPIDKVGYFDGHYGIVKSVYCHLQEACKLCLPYCLLAQLLWL